MRLVRQLASRGHPPELVDDAANVLDPNALMLGLARRFTDYKRPNLLLRDPARLTRLLNDPLRPVQLVLAGKAHPADVVGKRMIRDWIELAQQPEFRRRVDSSRIMTSHSPRSWCKASMCGSTRRADRGKRAVRAA